MKKIILLTNYKNIIPQRSHEIEGLKLDIIAAVLNEHNFEVESMTFQEFVGFLSEHSSLESIYFYYASSQYAIYKSFIQDILMQIPVRGGILVPDFRHFMAHENKSFQELEKSRLNIKSPKGIPIGTYEEGLEILKHISYPTVIKKSTGFRSRNVRLAKNITEGKKILKDMLENNFKFDIDSLYLVYRKFKNKTEYPKKFGKVIIQEFIPNLTHDWKILVLGNICVGGKRFVRKNDFRASGSKLYSLEQDPPDSILSFALSCKKQLKCPNVSLDICESDGTVCLLEYQTMHFSLLAWKSVHYFEFIEGIWQRKEVEHDLEYYMALGICQDIANHDL